MPGLRSVLPPISTGRLPLPPLRLLLPLCLGGGKGEGERFPKVGGIPGRHRAAGDFTYGYFYI